MMEILVPAGNEECANTAINCGADAIYLGLTSFSARAGAENFSDEALERVIKRAHLFGVKIYVAMNTVVKNTELEDFVRCALKVHAMGADAIIMQDIFIGKYIHETYPQITLHLSTQAGVNNIYGARLAKEYGFSRVILARETPFEDVKEIASFMETEVFIQGALCTCFSGQCYLSGFAGGNSGNRGRCKQPCRKKYSYDREGFEEKAYALSLADLSVGENILKLIDAGVVSFKIEGRMRRPEYISAAVAYYKKILSGGETYRELSALKRTYNRNNYTQGLTFSQDKRFLSRDVQGHMGEKVGVVMMRNKRIYCESNFLSRKGDCFKIIRKGKEVGGAIFEEKDNRGFYLSSKARLQNGDGVFVTTDTALNERLLSAQREFKIDIDISFAVGERAKISCGDFYYESDTVLEEAKSRPLAEAELVSCFSKSEYFTVNVNSVKITGNIFIAKSVLNEIRRRFFAELEKNICGTPAQKYEFIPFAFEVKTAKNDLKAVISNENIPSDIFIFKPNDYSNESEYAVLNEVTGEKYLYIPPFFSGEDLKIVENKLNLFDGVYCEGTWGIAYAREKNKALFAGTGFNVANNIDVTSLLSEAKYYAVSKELDLKEQAELASENSFVLTGGRLKVMDLIYCPFQKTCSKCDKRTYYTLTDENDREFTVRRYSLSSCRFEVYNCADLISSQRFTSALIDLSCIRNKRAVLDNIYDEEKLKKILKNYTFGHSNKTVL